MSDNKLLAENTVRRFMKLANVDTMTDNFVTEMYGKKRKDLEEELTDTEDADEIEEINVAIELVKEALDGTDANQFKNVGDVGHFWPPLLYPPPCFVL